MLYRVENPAANAKTKPKTNTSEVNHSSNESNKPNELKKSSDHLNQPQILVSI